MTNEELWEAFQAWFRGRHPETWSKKNQQPEWLAFKAGAQAAEEAQA